MADVLPVRDLTVKQERFVNYYLGECKGNGVAAARLAGYSGSDKALSVAAARALANVRVRARIEAVLEAEAMPAREVLARLTAIARADWQHFVQVRHDIRGEVVDARLVLADQVKALELLGKHYGLFTEKTEVSATVLRIEGLDVRDV